MNNRFIMILVACVVVFIGLIFFIKKDAAAPSGEATTSNHTQGAGTTGITLLEYGDFQCPACAAYYPLLKEVKSKYGDQITFQFRHFPIVGAHPNAMSAHRAAEAAAMQDKFWEMHDMLYERQSAWAESNNAASIFRGYAEELGLDMDRYNNDLVKAEIATTIRADQDAGKDIGVTGTPGLILDGKLLDLASVRSAEDLNKLIDEAIAAKQ